MSLLEDDDEIIVNFDDEEPEVIEAWSSEESNHETILSPPTNTVRPSPSMLQNNTRSNVLRNRLESIRTLRNNLRMARSPNRHDTNTPLISIQPPVVQRHSIELIQTVQSTSQSTDANAPEAQPASLSASHVSNDDDQEAQIQSDEPQAMDTNVDATTDDHSPKSKLDEPETTDNDAEKKETNKLNDSLETGPGTCLICYEYYDTSTEHRIVALKCGHLYGKKCIETWMHSIAGKPRCPECNTIFKKTDIRIIYAQSIKALDTSELDKAKSEIDKLVSQNNLLAEQLDECKCNLGLKESEIYKLKKELNEKDVMIENLKTNRIKNALLSMQQQVIERKREVFKFRERISIPSGGARLISTFEILDYVIISHRIKDNLYDGFGLRKFSISNLRRVNTVPLHKKMIRDMAIHSQEPLILTASMDRTIKLTNMINISVIRTFNMEVDPWTVCWDANNSTRFFAGLNNGKVVVCCTMTGSILNELNTPLKSPLISIQFVNTTRDERPGLLLVGMNASLFGQFQTDSGAESSHELSNLMFNSLNIEDRFLSAHVLDLNNSGHFLLSCRPSSKINAVHHWLLDFTFENVESPLLIQTNLNKSFTGGSSSSMMTKSKIFPHPNDVNSALLCCSDEQEKGIVVWESSNEEPLQKLKCGSAVLDVALMKRSSEMILIALTDSELLFFSWSL